MGAHDDLRRDIKGRLFRQWGRRLYLDFANINQVHLGGLLSFPVLDIAPDLGSLGRYCAETRTLSVSLRHIENDPWVAVLETLKHEMAHQYVAEVLRRPNEVPHGPAWRQVCGRLGITPRATWAGAHAAGHDPMGAASGEDPRLRKVRKLLALGGNNPNEHEVQAALDKAHALMLRYNLQLADVAAADRELRVRWVGEPQTRVERYLYGIARILDDYFFVRAIWVPTYIPERDRPASQLELCGEEANLEMAAYIHDNLVRQLPALWLRYRRAHNGLAKGIRARNSYFDGVLSGFGSQLEVRRREIREEGLIWVGDARLDELYRRRNPRIHTARVGGYVDPNIRRDGVEAGEKLRISRPVQDKGKGVRGLLAG